MVDNFGLKIGLEGEKEFKKAIADINQSFKVLGSEMKLVSSEFGKNDSSMQAVAARSEVLNKQIDAQKQKIEGRVLVTFIINRDGSIANIKVVKSVHPLLDNEARRVVKLMPHWKPGIEDGKPCRTMFAIPIEFKL